MARLRRATGPRRSTDEWRALIARFSASSLNVPAFCQYEGISEASFYRWRGLLADVGIESSRNTPPAGAAFVDLGTLPPPQIAGGCIEIRLDLGGGIMLHLVRG